MTTARERVAERRVWQHGEDLAALMSTPAGRRVVHWLIYDVAGLQDASFFPGADGRHGTAEIKDGVCAAMHMTHVEGRRSVGLRLYSEIKAVAAEELATMVIEDARAFQADLALEQEQRSAERTTP